MLDCFWACTPSCSFCPRQVLKKCRIISGPSINATPAEVSLSRFVIFSYHLHKKCSKYVTVQSEMLNPHKEAPLREVPCYHEYNSLPPTIHFSSATATDLISTKNSGRRYFFYQNGFYDTEFAPDDLLRFLLMIPGIPFGVKTSNSVFH